MPDRTLIRVSMTDVDKAVSEVEQKELSAEEIERLSADSEGGPAARVAGWLGWLTGAVALGLALYALYWTQFSVTTSIYRASFLAISLTLIFMLYPLVRPGQGEPRAATPSEWIFAGLGVAMPLILGFGEGIFASAPVGGAILLVTAACFAAYPLATRSRWLIKSQIIDWAFCLIAIASAAYLALYLEDYKNRVFRPSAEELALGGVLILLVLEATRRTVGWILPAIAAAFLVYCYFGPSIPQPFDHRGFSFSRIIGQNYLTLEGVFSTPIDVAATFIVLFTIYGAVLERGGAGKFFIDWAFALFGKRPSPSAPGRAAVSAGFLLGTVSGSGVATTVTVASLAWPMLRRSGYPPNVAGGMLAAAGIGATLSPPTLGAAAFIIAEYLNVEYLEILIYATIPTLLYYFSCWLMTEGDARRLNVAPVKTSDASLWRLTMSEGYHFLSLGAIAVLLVLGYTSFLAVFWSIAIAFALSMLKPHSRLVSLPAAAFGAAFGLTVYALGTTGATQTIGMGEFFAPRASVAVFWGMMAAMAFSALQALAAMRAGREPAEDSTRLVLALADGSRSVLGIVATCACAGVIVSVVNLTGLGLTISSLIVDLGGGSRFIVILLAALAMWVLGAAVPVTASYIIAAVMLVPALTKVGVPEPAAHMFMFYYAVLADVSPPTALSPFAAAAITRGSPFPTMIQAWKYTLPAFIVPFMFCLAPEGLQLLMFTTEGKFPATLGEWGGVLGMFALSCLAMSAFCFAATGYLFGHANALLRGLAAGAGVLMLSNSAWMIGVGAALFISVLGVQMIAGRREAARAS